MFIFVAANSSLRIFFCVSFFVLLISTWSKLDGRRKYGRSCGIYMEDTSLRCCMMERTQVRLIALVLSGRCSRELKRVSSYLSSATTSAERMVWNCEDLSEIGRSSNTSSGYETDKLQLNVKRRVLVIRPYAHTHANVRTHKAYVWPLADTGFNSRWIEVCVEGK